MTPDQFKAWRKSRGFKSQQSIAEALGISKGAIENYEAGRRRDNGEEVAIPESIILACAAIDIGIRNGEVDPKKPETARAWAEALIAHVRAPASL